MFSTTLQYNVIGRVRELNLLKTDSGLLSKLEANGVDLATLEKLLPAIESSGLLTLVGSSQQFVINLLAPLLVEPATILIPVLAGALSVGPAAFFGTAAACGLTEVFCGQRRRIPWWVFQPAPSWVSCLFH